MRRGKKILRLAYRAGSDCGLDNIGDVNGALERGRSLGGHGVVSSSGNSDGVGNSGGNSALDSN